MPPPNNRPDQLRGKVIWDIYPHLKGAKSFQEFQRALTEQVPLSYEIFSEVVEAWLEVHVYPSPNGLSVYFKDVTQRKEAETMAAERAQVAMLNGDIGLALTQGRTLKGMLRRCTEVMVQDLDAAFARVWTLNAADNILELQASAGLYTHLDGPHSHIVVGQYKIGRIAQTRQPFLTNNVLEDEQISDPEWAKQEGMVAFAGYPLIVDDMLVGVMALFARQPFSASILDAMSVVSYGIALGIERKQADEERNRLQEEIIQLQATHLEELSTPLIPLSEEIVVMPLIGTIDARRASRIMEVLASGAVVAEAQIAILDITGVVMIDHYVASAIIKAAQVLRLLGVETVLTGIQPLVAQRMADLQIDLTDLTTRSTLQSGIKYAQERLRARTRH
jgi:anti-anti-sigma regulatory factor